MKKFHVIVCFTALLGLFSNAGCKKETATNISLPPDPPLNTAPYADAGQDIPVILPIDFCMLYGSASDAESNIKSHTWKKISGPSGYILENPDSLATKVSKLEKGVYEFELTVTDKAGLTGKDITTVTVRENTAPKANAGQDIQVVLPNDFCMIYGSTSDVESDIKSYAWKKISGPSTYILESPDLLATKVSNLEKGFYEFELVVTDEAGLTGTDTTTITVGEMSSNPTEIVFKDLSWGHEGLFGGLLWGSVVGVRNIYTYLPVGNVFKVYIQRDGSPDWVEVSQSPLENALTLILMNGYLGVYSDFDETDTPNLKIVY